MTKQKHFYLIRGLIRESGHWGKFLNHLKDIFPDARVTALEIPGAGIYCKSKAPLSISKMVEEMRRDYLKHSALNEESIFITLSLGGMIASSWLHKFPEDFQGAVLINTSFGGFSPFHHRIKPQAFPSILQVPLKGPREKEAVIIRLISNHKNVFDETLNAWEKIQRERPVSLSNALRQLIASATYRPKKVKPTVPILILGAKNDRMVNIECSRAISRIWELDLFEHPTGGHDLTVDDPEWIIEKIKSNFG